MTNRRRLPSWILMVIDLFPTIAVFEAVFVAGALGRAACAMLAGMRVEAVVFGIGPPLARWRRIELAAFPLGAFCRIAGFDPCQSPVPTEDPRAFHNRPLLLRLLVALGWPIGVQAVLIITATCVFLFAGKQSPTGAVLVTQVNPAGPADRAGLRAGDEIVGFAGSPVDYAAFVGAVQAAGDVESAIDVRRAGATEHLRIHPRLDGERFRLGILIAPMQVSVPVGLGRALVDGVRTPFVTQELVLAGAVEVYAGRNQAELAGPLGVGRAFRDAPTAADRARFLLSVGATAVLWALLPFPPLPGARFWMVLAGWRGRRRRSPVAARDAGTVERERRRFPLALLVALVPLALVTLALAYKLATTALPLVVVALAPLALVIGLALGRPRAWAIAILVFVPLVSPDSPLAITIHFAMCFAIFATLHIPSVRRYFGLSCPVCDRVAARPVPASRRIACMACGSTWRARR